MDLGAWLQAQRLTLLVYPYSDGWRATFAGSFAIEDGGCAKYGEGATQQIAVGVFLSHMYGKRLSTNLPGQIVPSFTGLNEALANATHSGTGEAQ